MEVVDLQTAKRIKAADDNADATKWVPRDVLVDMIRAIDAGEAKPETLAIVWFEPTESGNGVIDRYSIAVGGDQKVSHFKAAFLAEAFKRSVWGDG